MLAIYEFPPTIPNPGGYWTVQVALGILTAATVIFFFRCNFKPASTGHIWIWLATPVVAFVLSLISPVMPGADDEWRVYAVILTACFAIACHP